MKANRLFTLLLFLMSIVETLADQVDTTAIVNLNMPVLHISTINAEEPTCDFVFPPEGAFGISITNAVKVPGRALLTLRKDTLFDSGSYEEKSSGMTIKIRGNTSAYYYNKKPYKIKLQKKGDMLHRGDKRFNDKDWLLVCDGDDNFNVMIGLKVSELMGLGWTPAYEYVNLIMNGEYRGIYMLIESVDRNADCRINVDKNTGYLFERDAYWWNEDVYFTTTMNKEYTFKYPDDDDITQEQIDYIKAVMDTIESSFADGTYPDYIDVKSFASWLLAHDILGTYDSGGSNIYLTKYDNTEDSKVQMVTLWDFSSNMKIINDWARVHDDFFYFKELFKDPNTYFTYIFKKVWAERADNVFNGMKTFLSDFLQSKKAQNLTIARVYDHYRWNINSYATVEDNINAALAWFNNRREWLDKAIDSLEVNTMHIENTAVTQITDNNGVYNLQGQLVSTTSTQPLPPGIYIRNGRKFLVR